MIKFFRQKQKQRQIEEDLIGKSNFKGDGYKIIPPTLFALVPEELKVGGFSKIGDPIKILNENSRKIRNIPPYVRCMIWRFFDFKTLLNKICRLSKRYKAGLLNKNVDQDLWLKLNLKNLRAYHQ